MKRNAVKYIRFREEKAHLRQPRESPGGGGLELSHKDSGRQQADEDKGPEEGAGVALSIQPTSGSGAGQWGTVQSPVRQTGGTRVAFLFLRRAVLCHLCLCPHLGPTHSSSLGSSSASWDTPAHPPSFI